MLSRDELNQIGQLFDERFDKAFDKKVKPLKAGILRAVGRLIRKEFNVTNAYFDRITTDHEKRIKRVESHVGLPHTID